MRTWTRRVAIGCCAAVVLATGCTASEPDSTALPSAAPTTSGPAADTPEESPGAQPTPTPDPTPTPEPPFVPRQVSVAMNGDILLHEGLWATAQIDARRTGRGAMDFRPLLANMRPVFTGADLAICHMETPLAPAGGPYLGYPVFSVPPQIVSGLKWAGFDVCTTASNHSVDQGFDGLVRTIDDLDAAGVAHTGTFATRRASRQPLVMDVEGVRVGLVSSTYGTNGIPLPAGKPWSVNLIDPDRIIRQAGLAHAAGAEIVIVALHWGSEYVHEPSSDQLAVAEQLTASPDIDLVYGHHAHVVQPYDRVQGTWVLYGQGNAVAQQSTDVPGLYDGNTARVTFVEKRRGGFRVAKLEYIPTMVTTFDGVHPMRYLDVARALEQRRYAAWHDELRGALDRVTENIDLEGALDRGVTLGG